MENDIQNQSEITPEQNICTFPIKKLRETTFPNKSLESSWFCLYLCCKILSLLAVCFCFLFSISRDGNVPEKENEEKLRHTFEWFQGLTERFALRSGKNWTVCTTCGAHISVSSWTLSSWEPGCLSPVGCISDLSI